MLLTICMKVLVSTDLCFSFLLKQMSRSRIAGSPSVFSKVTAIMSLPAIYEVSSLSTPSSTLVTVESFLLYSFSEIGSGTLLWFKFVLFSN